MPATPSNSNRLGTSSDDHFLPGRDSAWGATGGSDTLYFSGTVDDYEVIRNSDGSFQINDLRSSGHDVSIKVRDIDRYVFVDTRLSHAEIAARSIREISCTSRDDGLAGNGGNDRFTADAGDDRIWGGNGGEETVAYSGNISDYALRTNFNGSG